MFPGCHSLTRTLVVAAAEVAVEAEEVPAGETRWRPASR
jgi:hypothetical protein